jgi:hypothetical protein
MFQWALWRANLVYNARFRGDAPGTYLSLIIERFLLVHGQRTFYRKGGNVGCEASSLLMKRRIKRGANF